MEKKIKPYIIKREGYERVLYRNESYWKEIDKKRYDILLRRSGIPHFYWSIDFKDYKGDLSKANLKKVIQYSEECFTDKFEYVNLYLYSKENSSQKTAISCNVGKEAIRQNKKVQFILAGSLIDMLLKQSGFTHYPEIANELKKLKESDLLIIDDVFDTKKSVHWQNSNITTSEWDRFLRELLVSRTKVVMTSNMTIDEIQKNYGKSMKELINRNFIDLEFKDSITKERKRKFDNLFD